MNNPLVSVIVPVYKVEKYLSTCIESVLHQSYSNWELILVDDGSPDQCPQICDEYSSRDSRIKVIHKDNGRVAKARNAALRVAKGDYIMFLDSDDFIQKDTIKDSVRIAATNDADIVQFGFIRGNEKKFPDLKRTDLVTLYNNHSVFTSTVANVIVCAKLYKKHIFDGRLIVEDKFFEDDYTTWKWYYAATRIALMHDAYYYYTCNENSTMAMHKKKPNWDFLDAYDERINFFVGTKEEDLEHCSRLQLCKSMVLTYSNPNLSEEEKQMVKSQFDENYHVISSSKYVPISFKFIFLLFYVSPMMTSCLVKKVR